MRNELRIAQLIKVCKTIEGRKKLQKLVHILQEGGFSFSEQFALRQYGPYSSELKREIDQIVSWKLVKETEQQLTDFSQFIYTPTDKLNEFLGDEVEREPAWGELAKKLNEKSADELESISTIMFLRRHGFDSERLKNRFCQLKPHLEGKFDDALVEVTRIQKFKN